MPRTLLALAIGAVAGVGGYHVGLPLPWMLGPMLAVTCAAMLHLPIAGPDPLRPIVIPIIGVMLGSAVTPDVVGEIGQWATTLLLLPFVLMAVAGVSYVVYRRIGRYDPVTAFYSAMPGGLNEMLLMGQADGGDERRIALAHAARVLLVIFFVALYFGLVLGVTSGAGSGTWTALTAISLTDYLVLGACAVLGVPAARVVRLPAAPVFGPMLLSGVAHVAGWVHVAPPSLLIVSAQIVVGTVIGSRFIGATPREVGRDLALAGLATVLMLFMAVMGALLATQLITMPVAQAFLAFAPGGLTEMSLLTLAIEQDVAFVSVTHIVRITMVIGVAPILFRAIRRWIAD